LELNVEKKEEEGKIYDKETKLNGARS
jgi:hypothetical protein